MNATLGAAQTIHWWAVSFDTNEVRLCSWLNIWRMSRRSSPADDDPNCCLRVHSRKHRPNPMNAHKRTEVGILLATFAWLCLAGCKEKPRSTPPPPAVEVATVTQADVPIYHEWIGTLDGLVNATIRAQVNGYLTAQDYREGDAIKKGDLLFEIDPRPFQAVLDQAKGQFAQTEARLGKTE